MTISSVSGVAAFSRENDIFPPGEESKPLGNGVSLSKDLDAIQTKLIRAVNQRNLRAYQSILVRESGNPFLPFVHPAKGECSSWHTAAMIGATDILAFILRTCSKDTVAVVDIREEGWNKTALHYAAWSGNVNTVRFLLVNGASTGLQTFDKQTPLHYAAEYGYVDVVKVLLEYGADVNVKNETSQTPAHLCAVFGNTVCFQILVDH